MATYEHDILQQYKDEKSDIHIIYPVTKGENVDGAVDNAKNANTAEKVDWTGVENKPTFEPSICGQITNGSPYSSDIMVCSSSTCSPGQVYYRPADYSVNFSGVSQTSPKGYYRIKKLYGGTNFVVGGSNGVNSPGFSQYTEYYESGYSLEDKVNQISESMVDTSSSQTITGVKNFSNGLQIGGKEFHLYSHHIKINTYAYDFRFVVVDTNSASYNNSTFVEKYSSRSFPVSCVYSGGDVTKIISHISVLNVSSVSYTYYTGSSGSSPFNISDEVYQII